MSRSSHKPDLQEIERSRLEQISAQFNAAWQTQGPHAAAVYLSAFLPPPGDRLREVVLRELIPKDLEYRWNRGEGALLEDYLESFSELGSLGDLPPELIHAEYRARCRSGDAPLLDSYQQRFPRQFHAFQELLGEVQVADTVVQPDRTHRGTLKSGERLRSSGPRRIAPVGEGYQLLERIGAGNFGEVWRGIAPGGVEVAVKIIRWSSGDQLTQVELRALELIKRLRHAFLVQVQTYWLVDDRLYIVMDLADCSLQQRFDQCQGNGQPGIPLAELLRYMREAAEALDYLHSNQVLHRDIKPANILLASGHARLADFGVARLIMPEGTDVQSTMIGTPLYMSPEVWDKKVGPGSDQYSLASTYVELRLGRPLFPATTQHEVMMQHLTARPDLNPLPAAEQRVLHKALAKKIEARYSSCAEFVEALQAAAEPKSKRPPTTKLRMIILTLLLLAGTAAGGTVAALTPWLLAPTVLPPRCEPAEGARREYVREEGKCYWNRIICRLPEDAVLPSGTRCELVLIRRAATPQLSSFYIMENKVWNELFAAFNEQYVRDHPQLARASDWPDDWARYGARRGAEDMPAFEAGNRLIPVMNVTYNQAVEFAKWLGGSVPSCEQWDSAAGLYRQKVAEPWKHGPFKGQWNAGAATPQIAVARGDAGPRPVGEAADDVSPFGCHDMAGNGNEWTSEESPPPGAMVTLRGQSYDQDRPLAFDDLRAQNRRITNNAQPPDEPLSHVGFRIVIEPPKQ